MEDQQSASGDLTDTGAGATEGSPVETTRRRHRMPVGKARRQAGPTPAVDAEAPTADGAEASTADGAEASTADGAEASDVPDAAEVRVAPDASDAPEADDATEAGDSEAPDPELTPDDTTARQVVFVERKPAGPGAKIAVGVAAALFVGAGAFAGAMAQPYLADRAQVDTKVAIATTAAEAITTLFSYTPDNMETLADRSAGFLGGDFEAQYRKYIDAIVPTNKQAQVSNTTQVVGAAVESLNGPDATAIVYTNTTSMSPLSKNIPAMQYLSYRLTLRQDAAKWLVTKMSTITSLDLTPRI